MNLSLSAVSVAFMLIGFGLPVSGAWAQPDHVAGFATWAEARGYHSVWTFQRLLVGAGQQLDPGYHSVLDPLVSLAFAAARTSRIRLGVAVVNAPFVSPVYLAKQAATLDVLSRGRLDLGLGTGWSAVEFAATGASPQRRGARLVEYLAVLQALWSGEVTEYHGEFYSVPAGRMLPAPVQRPGPPVLLGGSVPAALRRAGRLAAGWVSRSGTDLSRIDEDIAVVRAAARRAGRDPAALRIVCRGVLRPGPRGPMLSGSYDEIRADTARLAEMGVTELFYDLNWDPLVGAPDADPDAATHRAGTILDALAPVPGQE
jgi:probable F420-dependent oxidoreductase